MSADGHSQTARTNEEGGISISLRPAAYTVETVKPTVYKGKSLLWAVPITVKESGAENKWVFTDGDAKSEITPTNGRRISEEAGVYQAFKAGVVTVESDWGHGSGFLFDKANGLILTNQHVIGKTQWVAVRLDRGLRYAAVVVGEDKDADLAVVRINPDVAKDLPALKIADTSKGLDVVEGERVLAIGSPLRQEKIMTTGIISKVEKDVLISDVNINHGNSGGPLLNTAGEVIGVTTFGDIDANRPGISGIVSIAKAVPLIKTAQNTAEYSASLTPSADRLPDISLIAIDGDVLNKAAHQNLKPLYFKEPRGFETRIFTPFTLISLNATYEREVSKGRDSRVLKRSQSGVKSDTGFNLTNPFWTKYALDAADPVVIFEVKPGLHETRGSKNRAFWGAMAGAMSGTPAVTKREVAFNNDFYDMELYKGGKKIEPLRRYRVKLDELFDSYFFKVNDSAYGGMYFYDPSVLDPSEPITIYVRDEADLNKRMKVELSSKNQKELYGQFAEYLTARNASSPAPAVPTAPLPPQQAKQ